MLGSKEIERLAGWSTRAGLTTEIAGVKEVAAPYMEMNTKELVLEGAKLVKMGGVEGAKLVNASILQPSYARVDEGLLQPAKARATPYVAPYIARGLDTKDAVMSDEAARVGDKVLRADVRAVLAELLVLDEINRLGLQVARHIRRPLAHLLELALERGHGLLHPHV